MAKRLTTKDFIIKSINIHGGKFDYSLVEYKNNKTKVKIICPTHGIFEQRPNAHLQGYDCFYCNGNTKMNTSMFIKKSKKIHRNKFDYSLVDYKTDKIKVKIICPTHGIFEQSPNIHYNHDCYECSNDNRKMTIVEFIERSKKLHGDKFDYSEVNYIDIRTKVKIVCPIHGVFEQTPESNLKGNGCVKCCESKGEKIVRDFLQKNKIYYKNQHMFEDCKNIKKLPFDFYLPELNICIEYDGKQHYEPIKYWGSEKTFKMQQKRDKIKNKYCDNNNIKLLRIKYNENVYEKLSTLLK